MSMKRLMIIAVTFGSLSYLFSQPPGSPKNTPGSDTSTVETDGANMKDPNKQRSDTAANVPEGPKRKKKK